MRAAFLAEAFALEHAETVLLVDDDEAQIAEADRFLDQRVRADDDVRRTRGETALDLIGFRARGRSCEQRHRRHPELSGLAGVVLQVRVERDQEPRDAFEVLAREHFGRHHERALPAVAQHVRHHRHCHERLAGAHVAFQETRHRLRFLHVAQDFVDGDFLASGRREFEGREQRPDQLDVHRRPEPLLRSALPLQLTLERLALEVEHLLEPEARGRLLDLLGAFRKMQGANRIGA